MEDPMDEVYRLHHAGDQMGAFLVALSVLKVDCERADAHDAAIKLLKRHRGAVLQGMMDLWLQAGGFGNLDNAAVLLPQLFDSPQDHYGVCSILAAVAVDLGKERTAMALFANCLSADLPPPVQAAEVAEEYQESAAVYELNQLHVDSVVRFTAFLDKALGEARDMVIADIPCGAGEAAPWLRRRASRLIGSDLSPHMLAIAEATGLYDQAIAGDMVEALPSLAVDMVFAHGSLYYFRDLAPVASAAAKALRPGGWFAFTDYPAPSGTMVTISGNQRYCRSPDLVRKVLAQQGFEEAASELGLTFGLPCLYWLFRKA